MSNKWFPKWWGGQWVGGRGRCGPPLGKNSQILSYFFGTLLSPSAAEKGNADKISQEENRPRNCDGNRASGSQTLNIEPKMTARGTMVRS